MVSGLDLLLLCPVGFSLRPSHPTNEAHPPHCPSSKPQQNPQTGKNKQTFCPCCLILHWCSPFLILIFSSPVGFALGSPSNDDDVRLEGPNLPESFLPLGETELGGDSVFLGFRSFRLQVIDFCWTFFVCLHAVLACFSGVVGCLGYVLLFFCVGLGKGFRVFVWAVSGLACLAGLENSEISPASVLRNCGISSTLGDIHHLPRRPAG